MSRPVLVTGAAGFAGSHLLESLVRAVRAGAAQRSIHAWTRPAGTPAFEASDAVGWSAVDLLDRTAVDRAISDVKPSVVYHCAGSPHVASSWTDPLAPLQLNVLTTHHLFMALERHAPDAQVLVPSSALVYAPSNAAISEEAPLVPRTPYGVSKLAQERLAAHAASDRGLHAFVARPFNHIGPRQDASFVASAFAKQIAEAEAGMIPPVLQVGNLDARRDLTDVRDTVRAYQLIVQRGKPGRTYNVCSGRAHRVGDLLDRLLALAAVRLEVTRDPERLRPSDTPVLLGDPSRIERELGWRAAIPIEQTLMDLLQHWRGRVRARVP